jgi:hypothetical protein
VGQGLEMTPNAGERIAAIGSRQEFNSYLWTANLALNQSLANRWRLLFAENVKTSLLRLGSEGDRWKDDQNLDAQLSYLLLPHLNLLTRANSILFFDKQSGFNNDVQSSTAAAGLVYTPYPQISACLMAGPKWDSRMEHQDRGAAYEVNLSGNGLRWQEYNHRLEFALDEDVFQQRRNSNLSTLYQIGRVFAPGVADSFQVIFTNRRRDNYVSIEEEIESQRENVKGANNALFYQLNPALHLSLTSLLEFKNVELLQFGETSPERRRKRNDQKITNDLGLDWQGKSWQGQFALSHALQEQRYDLNAANSDRPFSSRIAFITPDNKSSRLVMTGYLSGRVGGRDSLSIFISVGRFRYDTPDSTNFDDRDELRVNTRAVWAHRFSSVLRTEWLAGVNLYHMVYIFGERSADNNWNRIAFVRPEIVYTPNERVQFNQSFEVLANYVDYDFEEAFVLARSFVFRKFAMSDSLHWKIMRRSVLLADYRLQLEENGQLSWKEWSERIVGTRTLQWLHLYWQFTAKGALRTSAGYAVFKRDEWKHSTDVLGKSRKEPSGNYISYGPVLRLYYLSRSNLRMLIDAARYRVDVSGQKSYYVNTIELGLRWAF